MPQKYWQKVPRRVNKKRDTSLFYITNLQIKEKEGRFTEKIIRVRIRDTGFSLLGEQRIPKEGTGTIGTFAATLAKKASQRSISASLTTEGAKLEWKKAQGKAFSHSSLAPSVERLARHSFG